MDVESRGCRPIRVVVAVAVAVAIGRGAATAHGAETAAAPAGDADATRPAPGSDAPGAAPATGAAKSGAEIRASQPAEIVGSESDARHELAEAQRLLDEGEEAGDDATRRAKYESARDHAARAVAAMPKSADAHFVRFAAAGRLAQMKGIAKLAIEMVDLNKELDHVLELDPDHANALAARGGMYMRLPRLLGGDKSKGVAYLERAVALDATAIGKRLELAEAYRATGRDGDAGRVAVEARAVAVAERKPDKVANCDAFLGELRKSCPTCAPEPSGASADSARPAPGGPAPAAP